MDKRYSNLLKIVFILVIPSLAHTTYAQSPTDVMNRYCATHNSPSAQRKCTKYFWGYWYENENYYDEEPYTYYPNSYYYPNTYDNPNTYYYSNSNSNYYPYSYYYPYAYYPYYYPNSYLSP